MKMAARALGAFGLLAGAVAVWLSSQGRGVDPGAVDATPVVPSQEAAGATVAADPVRRAAAHEDAAATAADSLRVLVVDGGTGLPEPGAEVFFFRPQDVKALSDSDHEEYSRLQYDVEACARRFGTTVHAAADGVAWVPRPGWMAMMLGARSGARFGQQASDYYDDAVRIELWAERTLRIRTVGPAGEPVSGVQLALAFRWPEARERQVVGVGISGGDGTLELPHFQERLADWERVQSGPPEACMVLAEVPGLDHAGVPIDVMAIPAEPVVVPLPATGRLVVEVWRGRALLETGVILNLHDVTRSSGPRLGSPRTTMSASGIGRVNFSPVALGSRFRVQAAGLLRPVEASGPTRAGEEARIRCELDEAHPLLEARVVDESGAACSKQSVEVSVQLDGDRVFRMARTDAEGVFRLLLAPRLVGRSVRRIEVAARLRRVPSGLMARADPARALEPGVLDLGDLVLVPAPLIVSGMVCDATGRPWEPPLPFFVRPANQAKDRGPALFVSKLVDRGAFTIRGFIDEEELALVLHPIGIAPIEPVPFRRGASGLRIVVQPLVAVSAVLRHDLPYEQAKALRLVAVDEASGTAHTRFNFQPLARDRSRLRLGDLNPGRYTIHVRLPGDPVPLATIAGVELGPGAPPDPHLREIDIRGRVRVARLEIADHAGRPVGRGASLLLHDDLVRDVWLRTEGSVLGVPIGSRPLTGTLRVTGFRDHAVRGLDGDRTIRLEAPVQARVRLTPPLALPPGVTLHAFARPKGQEPNPLEAMFRQQRGPIAGSGTAGVAQPEPGCFAFELPAPGDYAFTFVLAARGETASVALATAPADASVPPAGQVADFSTEPAEVARALAALR